MLDRESVITHLQIIHTWAEFAREHDLQFFTAKHLEDIVQWTDDALKLLKSQPDIVQCGECKHYKDGFCYNPNTFDEKTCGNTVPDWFCADGKRRETE